MRHWRIELAPVTVGGMLETQVAGVQ